MTNLTNKQKKVIAQIKKYEEAIAKLKAENPELFKPEVSPYEEEIVRIKQEQQIEQLYKKIMDRTTKLLEKNKKLEKSYFEKAVASQLEGDETNAKKYTKMSLSARKVAKIVAGRQADVEDIYNGYGINVAITEINGMLDDVVTLVCGPDALKAVDRQNELIAKITAAAGVMSEQLDQLEDSSDASRKVDDGELEVELEKVKLEAEKAKAKKDAAQVGIPNSIMEGKDLMDSIKHIHDDE